MADTVPMLAPTGEVADVPADQVEYYKSKGAKLIEPAQSPQGSGLSFSAVKSYLTNHLLSPTESLIPKDVQMKAASAIAGAPQTDVGATNVGLLGIPGMIREAQQLPGTISAAVHQPMATARGAAAGVTEGVSDLLTPLNLALAAGPKIDASAVGRNVGDVLENTSVLHPLKGIGRLISRFSTPEAQVAESVLTTAEKTALARKGYSPELIQKIEQQLAKQSKDFPPDSPAPPPRAPVPSGPTPNIGPRPGSAYVKDISSSRLVPPVSQYFKDLLPQGENLETLAQEATTGSTTAPARTAGTPTISTPAASTPATSSPASSAQRTQEIQKAMKDLYEKYGRGEVSKVVNPNTPEVATGDAVRSTGYGSRMPDNAQSAVLRDLQEGKEQASGVQRAITQLLKEYKRNQGPAQTPVAQQLYQLLKKMGYVQGQ